MLKGLGPKDVRRGCVLLPQGHKHLITDQGFLVHFFKIWKIVSSPSPTVRAEAGGGRLQSANSQLLQGELLLQDMELRQHGHDCGPEEGGGGILIIFIIFLIFRTSSCPEKWGEIYLKYLNLFSLACRSHYATWVMKFWLIFIN